MKIGVIGTINKDSVRFPDGSTRSGWGGILYNLKTLSGLLSKHDKIFPVCNIGNDCYGDIFGILNRIDRLDLSYINKVKENNNHCYLTYTDTENKREILKGGVPPLKYENIKPLLDCDIVLLNYISGRDIYLKALQKFRADFMGKIYVDIHSLTLGKRKDGQRFLRIPSNWYKVIAVADFIQMNRLELNLFSRCEKSSDIRADLTKLQSLLDIERVDDTQKIFIITSSVSGCYLYQKILNQWNIEHVIVAQKVTTTDSTGCGDCFSAGFISGLIKNKKYTQCCKAANKAAYHRLLLPLLYF